MTSTTLIAEDGEPARRYSAGAMALHWTMASLLVVQIGLGWYMTGLDDHAPARAYYEAIHISLGVTILLLTVARLALRLFDRPPPLSPSVAPWERILASTVHWLFYVMLFALTLSGWAMESIGRRPIAFWGAAWPHMPGLPLLLQGHDKAMIKATLEQLHGSPMVWILIVLVGVHVLAALKHQFDGKPVLWRMAPIFRRPG